jgi:hypothetical protein
VLLQSRDGRVMKSEFPRSIAGAIQAETMRPCVGGSFETSVGKSSSSLSSAAVLRQNLLTPPSNQATSVIELGNVDGPPIGRQTGEGPSLRGVTLGGSTGQVTSSRSDESLSLSDNDCVMIVSSSPESE